MSRYKRLKLKFTYFFCNFRYYNVLVDLLSTYNTQKTWYIKGVAYVEATEAAKKIYAKKKI